MQKSLKLAALGLALSVALPAMAQQASEGNWLVRGRAVYLDWDNGQSAGLPLGGSTKVEAENRWIPEVDITYFFTRNIAAELVLTYPQKIDIDVGGTKKGTIKALPPSLLLQYHFTDLGAFKPYVGAGVNYTRFYDRDNILDGAAEVEKDSFGWTGQIGFDVALNKNWLINIDAKYVKIDTDVKLNGSKIGRVDLDPWLLGIGIGYRF
ncbi:MAG: OmpW family outer membrane protein [Propionivibrio sp.]